MVAVAGREHRFIFHGVHMQFEGAEGQPWAATEPRISKICAIGRGLDRDEIVQGFESCTVPGTNAAE